MLLCRAVESEYADVVELANLAYRGKGENAGWNTEGDYIDGDRLTELLLRADLAAQPRAHLLVYRETEDGPLMGCVWLEPAGNDVWYLGLLSVRPALQKQQLGRRLLAAAEEYAKERGAQRIRMTVVNIRDVLIAWYERRGYALTGETPPFPYDDPRHGKPLRNDLHFVVLEKDLS